MANLFATEFTFLIICLHETEHSLLSRFRNPNEFVASEDQLWSSDEMDQNTYEDLLGEVPELRSHFKRRPGREPLRMPYLKFDPQLGDQYYFEEGLKETLAKGIIEEPEENMTTMTSTTTESTTLSVESYSKNSSQPARRWFPGWSWYGPKVATCYWCGVSGGTKDRIPLSPACHDAFDSQNWRYKTLARYFRARCYKNHRYWASRIETKWKFSRHHQYNRGLRRGYYGAYTGGCFKRFLDVGKVYTVRGCRSWPPKHGPGFADHRFRKLEYLLRGKKEGCVVSPHASLTPFSRAISLYVRYHVCVCNSKYCNSAGRFTAVPGFTIVLIYVVV